MSNANQDLIKQLLKGLKLGERTALAQAITLVESTREKDAFLSEQLLEALPKRKSAAMRIGVSGPPGAGKSTLIESLGVQLLSLGHKIAVLAIDPSSPKNQGSILGDKTRMPLLSVHERAYVRPTPSQGIWGGVARATYDAIVLCESADFDVIFIETIGVGQNEMAAAELCDVLMLVLDPTGGDELQGIKRGVLEFADLIVVNKAENDFCSAAEQMKNRYAQALTLSSQQENSVSVLCASALLKKGLDEIWQQVQELFAELNKSDKLVTRRRAQLQKIFWRLFDEKLLKKVREQFKDNQEFTNLLALLKKEQISIAAAVNKALLNYGK